MRKIQWLLTMTIALSIFNCGSDDGDGGITDEQRQLIMGQDSGIGLFHTGLANPLVLARDEVHSNVREFDLNSDGVVDITIRAFEDFGGASKGLTISTVSDSVRVSLEQGGIKALEQGAVVRLDTETWNYADQLPLAVLENGSTSGSWNMLGRRYVAIRMDIGNSRFLAWIELSVEDYDNYSFYNFAYRAVP